MVAPDGLGLIGRFGDVKFVVGLGSLGHLLTWIWGL